MSDRPTLSVGAAPDDDLRARVMAAVQAEPIGPRAAGVRKRARLIVAASLFSVVLSIAIGRPGLRGRPLAFVASLGLVWTVIGAVATWVGVMRGRSMLGRSTGWRMATAIGTPVSLLGASVVLGYAWPSTLVDKAGSFAHLSCLVGTTAFALAPFAAFMAMRRASEPVAPRLSGAAIAASAGAWGALGIELHCRYTSSLHVVIGHVLPVAFLVILGATLGGWVLGIRSENG
ncbi:MAG: NrsF family protein [Myxococcota bacterium]|nr:NrsF family protein [Myxococcota bacterium]